MIRRRAVCAFVLCSWLVSAAAADDEAKECTAADREAYLSEVRTRLYEFWQVPYANRTLRCTVLIKQNFRGEVMNAGIANCTEDPQIHKSVIDAAYEASPMPRPAVKACFKRDVIVQIESRAQAAD